MEREAYERVGGPSCDRCEDAADMKAPAELMPSGRECVRAWALIQERPP